MLDPDSPRRQRRRNLTQAVLLVVGMLSVLAMLAWLLVGGRGLVSVLVLGILAAAIRPKVPPRWILSMYGARPLPEAAAPELHRFVRVLAERAGLPSTPDLYYVASPLINAFALGRRDDAVLAVTDGLLRHLSSRQVAAVLAHEVSHVRSDDLWIMNLSDTVGRMTHALAYTGVLLVLLVPWAPGNRLRPLEWAATLAVLPTVVTLLQLALSRSREYDADLGGALLTGDPEGLASALEELERRDSPIWERMMVPHRRMPDPLLLRSHPPTDARARRLRELAASDQARHLGGGDPVSPAGHPPVTSRPRLRAPGLRW
jgi:heat shock protein HtpX